MNLLYRYVLLVISVCSITATLHAQTLEPPFDVNDVIEQVRYKHNYFESRDSEFLIDTSIAYCPKENGQGYSAVAFNGTNYLVVWEDEESGSWDIYGTRVSSEGVVIDQAGFAISARTSRERFPAVTSLGSNWLVVWCDGRYSSYSYDIFCARVLETGIILDPNGIAVCTTNNTKANPAVSSDGSSYMVVWQDQKIRGSRIDQSGYVYHPQGFGISPTGYMAEEPSITYGINNFLVTWHADCINDFDIYGTRVNHYGVVLDPSGIPICTAVDDQYVPEATFGGENWLVVWVDTRSDSFRIYGTRVNQAGVVLDSLGFCIIPNLDDQTMPDVASLGSNYFVIWSQNYFGIFGARVTLDGVVLDSSGIDISTTGYNEQIPSIAAGSTNYLVTWTEERFLVDWNVYGGRVNEDGVTLDSADILLSRTVNRQHSPAVAFGNSNYFVVWEDYRGDPYPDIYGARISQTGIILDSIGFPIATGEGSLRSPSVVYDGTNYLVVWSDGDIYGTRITQDGTILDTLTIPISIASGEQEAPSVAFDGTNYLVVWQDQRSSYYDDIYGARVDQSGNVLDPAGIAIATVFDYQGYPSVAFDGTNYFVVWEDYRSDNWDIYGARVSPNGVVLDPSGIEIATATAVYEEQPSVAFDGVNYLVVYVHWTPPYDPDIYGTLVNQDGNVLYPDSFAICTASYTQWQPTVDFDGTTYFVLWRHSGLYYDICGAKVSPWGSVINYFTVSMQYKNKISPALTHGQGGQLLMTYSGWTDSINSHPANTMRIWGRFYPFTGVEENMEQKMQANRYSFEVFPNPICKECNLKYNLSQRMHVNVSLFDVTGRLMSEIVNEDQKAEIYRKVFDMTDFPQGVYFIRLNTHNHSETKKIIFIK